MNQRMAPGTFLVLALIIATMFAQYFYTHAQLQREREQIALQFKQQTSQIDGAKRLRDQLDGIAGAIARLADEGNANAILVRKQLASQGIDLSPGAPVPQ